MHVRMASIATMDALNAIPRTSLDGCDATCVCCERIDGDEGGVGGGVDGGGSGGSKRDVSGCCTEVTFM